MKGGEESRKEKKTNVSEFVGMGKQGKTICQERGTLRPRKIRGTLFPEICGKAKRWRAEETAPKITFKRIGVKVNGSK